MSTNNYIKVKVLDVNTPTINGRVYTTEVVRKALEDECLKEKLENHMCFVYNGFIEYDPTCGMDMAKICGVVKGFELTDNALFAEVKDLSNEIPGCKALTNSDKFYVVGSGSTIAKDGLYYVEDFTIDYVYVRGIKE